MLSCTGMTPLVPADLNKTDTSTATKNANTLGTPGRQNVAMNDGVGGYYGNEQDVSYCIVTEVLAARLTKWQVIMEDWYRSRARSDSADNAKDDAYHTSLTIWLGRGAPRRWFVAPSQLYAGGFQVANAPTSVGRLSYRVEVPQASDGATYVVEPDDPDAAAGVTWNVRFPPLKGTVSVQNCTVIASDLDAGIVSVQAQTGVSAFSVQAQFA